MNEMEEFGLIGAISNAMGATEPAIRLLISLLLGYPIALIHRYYLNGKPSTLQHIYFVCTGLALGYFNYGLAIVHAVFALLFSYLTLLFLRGTTAAVIITFAFNMGYLLIGYYYSATNDYDINWTLPQCVLVLRLIGLVYDFYDGHHQNLEDCAKNKDVALLKRPTLLEYCAHMCFPTAFLVGPQFPMRRYQDFVDGKFIETHTSNDCLWAGARRLGLGVIYLMIYQVIGMQLSDDFIISNEFNAMAFWKRLIYIGLWARITLYKYISCWLLTEGACIMIGVSYNGKDGVDGKTKWDGLANVDIIKFENATEFNHYIQSFNTNTNNWVAQYVYKRLKFLGNRYLSQLAALLFLAVWHGFHSGYYLTFFFEFLIMFMEKDIQVILKKYPHVKEFFQQSIVLRTLLYITLKFYTFIFMGWSFAPFALLSFDRYWPLVISLNYIGFILFLPWPFIYTHIFRYLCKLTAPKIEHVE